MSGRKWILKAGLLAWCIMSALWGLAQGIPPLGLKTDPEVIPYDNHSTITCGGLLGPRRDDFQSAGFERQKTSKYELDLGKPVPRDLESSDYDVPVRIYTRNVNSGPIGDITLACKTSGPMVEHFAPVKFSFTEGDRDRESVTFNLFPHKCWGDECHPLKFEAAAPASTEFAPVLNWSPSMYLKANETPISTDREFHQVPVGYSKDPAFVSTNDARFLKVSMSTKWQFRPEDCWDEAEGGQANSNARLSGIGDRDRMVELEVKPADQPTVLVRVRQFCALWHSLGSEFSPNPSAYIWLTSNFRLAEGRERDQHILLPVRFVSTPFQTFIFALSGAFLGAFIRCSAAWDKLKSEKRFIKEILIALGAAAGAVLACFAGVWTNHPSMIFGLKLDPSHAGAAFAITLIGSGGTIIRKWLRDAQESTNLKETGKGDKEKDQGNGSREHGDGQGLGNPIGAGGNGGPR